MHVVSDCVDQFRLRQRPGAHDVAEIQLFANGDCGERHALGPVLDTVSGSERVSHGQDKTFGGLRVHVGQDKQNVQRLGHGQLHEYIDVISASALQQDVALFELRNERFFIKINQY